MDTLGGQNVQNSIFRGKKMKFWTEQSSNPAEPALNLPGTHIRRALYYRYLLRWTGPPRGVDKLGA